MLKIDTYFVGYRSKLSSATVDVIVKATSVREAKDLVKKTYGDARGLVITYVDKIDSLTHSFRH